MTDVPVSLRLPADVLERADALVPELTKLPEGAALGRASRAAVLRAAIVTGLADMERRAKRQGEAGGTGKR